MSIDLAQLKHVQRQGDNSVIAQCPGCFSLGHDRAGNHLRLWQNGAFNCAKYGKDLDHNRLIRSILRGYTLGEDRAEIVYVEPPLQVDQVYPEESLKKLMPIYDYWLGRGMREDVLRRLENGVAPSEEKSKLSGRSIFPCRNQADQIVGFAGRLVNENSYGPKWKILGRKTQFIFPRSSISQSHIQASSTAILVEGIGCTLALGAADVWNTLCLFGLRLSDMQLAWLLGLGVRRVIIATNNESSGIGNDAAVKLKSRLINFFDEGEVMIHLPYAKDFMDCSMEQIEEWKKHIYDPILST